MNSSYINKSNPDTKRKRALILFLGISIFSILFLTGFAPYQYHEEESDHPSTTDQELPIFDTHVHYKEPAWSLYSPKEVLDLFRKSGVTKALVSSSPDDGTRMLYNEDPNMIVPFLRPYHDDVTSSNWYGKKSILNYLQERLKLPIYKGIGEFHIHDAIDADSPVIQKIIQMAMEDDLFIHVHTGHEAVESIFTYEPDIKILWAHAGMSDPPQIVSYMFDEYANLWVDISIREYEIAPNGLLNPDWKALFLKHPDRITVGSDTWVNSRWEQYETILEFDRGWLDQLPKDIAEQIAYKNAENLFN
jgi:Amidohydrolase